MKLSRFLFYVYLFLTVIIVAITFWLFPTLTGWLVLIIMWVLAGVFAFGNYMTWSMEHLMDEHPKFGLLFVCLIFGFIPYYLSVQE